MTTTRERLAVHFPAFALEVRTPMLTLRYPDDDDLVAVAELAAEHGVHGADERPFTVPWTEIAPPYQQRNTLAYFWGLRPMLQAKEWQLPMAVVVDDEVAGVQSVFSAGWDVIRSVETGSWLARPFHGRGIGTEMRSAILHLAFDGLGVERAITAAYADNPASNAVTAKLGYRPNGIDIHNRGGRRVELNRYVMDPDDFAAVRRDDIELIGAAAVRDQFGTEQPPAWPDGASSYPMPSS